MNKKATITRMVTSRHSCPWGKKALRILKENNFEITDQHLESKAANKAYKKENRVTETPQISIDGESIGGYDELRKHLGLCCTSENGILENAKNYQPILAVFSITLLMAITATWAIQGSLEIIRILELFIAFSMCVLGILKLQNLKSFATGFTQYDLIAQRYSLYAYIYPFIEAGAGILMIGAILPCVAAPAALIISTIGAISVFKAVYLEKKALTCACVGGSSQVPLGFISLTENLMMIAMSIWILVKPFIHLVIN